MAVPLAKGKLSSSMPPFAPLREAPRMARAFARAELSQWGLTGFSDVAEMILAELVANAVNASAQAGEADVLVIRVCLISDGEVLTIEVWVTEAERVRLNFAHRIINQDGALILEAETAHVCTGLDEKPKRLPTALAESLRSHLKS